MSEITIDAAQFHAHARDEDAGPPPQLAEIMAQLEEAERMRLEAIRARDDVIVRAREVNVPYKALERWTGIGPRRLDQIANDR